MEKTYFKYLVDQTIKSRLGIFELALRECHPFIFMPEYKDIEEVETSEESLDLPYPIMSIEVLGQHLTVPYENGPQAYLNLLLVKELAPKEYMFMVYAEMRQGLKITPLTYTVTKEQEAYKELNGLLSTYLKRLSNEKIGIGPRENKIKLSVSGGKIFWRPKAVTIVSPKKYTSEAERGFRFVDWSHRWEVRGHWRTTSGVGKDRAGQYTVPGFTWVSSHTKGPENKPVIKKTYVVQ